MFKGNYRNASAVWDLARHSFGILVAIFLLSETGFASSQRQRALVESSLGLSKESIKNQGKITDADIEATRATAKQATDEGFKLYEQGKAESLKQAIVKWEQALLLWRKVDNKEWEALTLTSIGQVNSDLGNKQKALGNYNLALLLWRQVSNKEGEATTLNNIGQVNSDLGKQQEALDNYNQALPLSRQVEDKKGEAKTLHNIGAVYSDLGKQQEALNNYNQALTLRQQIGDKAGEAVTLNNIGKVYSDLGFKQKALDNFNLALPLSRQVEDKKGEVTTLNNIGTVNSDLGDKQKALEYINQALSLSQEVGDKAGEVATLNNIGQVYSELGFKEKALDYYNLVLPLSRQVGDKKGEATTLSNIGAVHSDQGQNQKALNYYNLALPLRRQVGDKAGEAVTLTNIGAVYSDLGKKQKALDYYNLALLLSQEVGDKAVEAVTLNNIGLVYSKFGEKQKALGNYNLALPLNRQVGDKTGEAITLANLALLERNQGNLKAALTYTAQATAIIENLRTAYTNKDLQTTYFATQQVFYNFYIDLLMQSHKQNPTKVCSAFDIKETCEAVALHISERQRARGLNELLTEAGADIRTGVKPELLEQEKLIQQQLDATQARQLQLHKGQRDQSQEQLLKKLKQEIASLNEQSENIKAEIRKKSPAYAALKYPEPLSLEQIQQQVLDDDTLLLQYSLGKERSYLWVVSKNSIKSYQLGKGADISAAAQAYNNLVNTEPSAEDFQIREKQIKDAGNKLSQLILSQAANQLGNKRLLIVGDGDLLTVPFVALPNPNKQDSPLIASHEIGALPSASSIAISRQQPNRQKVAPKRVAVIADPVFAENDPRLQEILRRNKPPAKPVTVSYRRTCGENLGRLEYSDDEANSIIESASKSNQRYFLAPGLAANYATVTNPQMSQYRIVHFATHACVPEGRPQDSRIALSRYNEKGEPTYKDLFLGDIFNLKLPAELVVLSACQTGLGKNVGGEGIIGFTRGFMYAGSKRVAVSLWNVKDTATYLLMKNFYQKMLERELTPSAALRETQLEMWKQGKSPYYWAGFTIQGEWR